MTRKVAVLLADKLLNVRVLREPSFHSGNSCLALFELRRDHANILDSGL